MDDSGTREVYLVRSSYIVDTINIFATYLHVYKSSNCLFNIVRWRTYVSTEVARRYAMTVQISAYTYRNESPHWESDNVVA